MHGHCGTSSETRVALHFDGNGQGGNIVVFGGQARRSTSDPHADRSPPTWTSTATSSPVISAHPRHSLSYSVALRIAPDRVRGH
jgi:hypothetical protein